MSCYDSFMARSDYRMYSKQEKEEIRPDQQYVLPPLSCNIGRSFVERYNGGYKESVYGVGIIYSSFQLEPDILYL